MLSPNHKNLIFRLAPYRSSLVTGERRKRVRELWHHQILILAFAGNTKHYLDIIGAVETQITGRERVAPVRQRPKFRKIAKIWSKMLIFRSGRPIEVPGHRPPEVGLGAPVLPDLDFSMSR